MPSEMQFDTLRWLLSMLLLQKHFNPTPSTQKCKRQFDEVWTWKRLYGRGSGGIDANLFFSILIMNDAISVKRTYAVLTWRLSSCCRDSPYARAGSDSFASFGAAIGASGCASGWLYCGRRSSARMRRMP